VAGSRSSCAERLQLRKRPRSLFLKSETEEENGERTREGEGREELFGGEEVEMGELQVMRLLGSHGHMDALCSPV